MRQNFNIQKDPEPYTSDDDVIVDAADVLFDIEAGKVVFGDEHMIPDEITDLGTAVSSASRGLLYTSPDSVELRAELFAGNPVGLERLDNFEVYPLDGQNKPFGVTVAPELAREIEDDEVQLASLCAMLLYRYSEKAKSLG